MELHRCAEQGDIDGVRAELAAGADVAALEEVTGADEAAFAAGRTALILAAGSTDADVEMLRILVAAGADPNQVGQLHLPTFPLTDDETIQGLNQILGEESGAGDLYRRGRDLIEELTAEGDIDPPGPPLLEAARRGSLDKVQFLLEAGAELDYVTPNGYTALIAAACPAAVSHAAAQSVVDYLVSVGARVDGVTQFGESAIRYYSRNGRFEQVRRLLNAGADASVLEWTPLMAAIALGDLDDVAAALASGESLHDRDFWEHTPFLLAAAAGDIDKAELLKLHGADVDERGRCGSTALQCAAIANRTEMIRWLIEQGADPNGTDDFGCSAVKDAICHNSLEAASILIESGASCEVYQAAMPDAPSVEMAALLCQHGADINYIDDGGSWLLKRAVEDGDFEFARQLVAMGADPHLTNIGASVLFQAVSHDRFRICQWLLELCVEVNGRDVDGHTPPEYCRSRRVHELLLGAGALR